MGRTLNAFSYLFHPLFVPIYAVLSFFLFSGQNFSYPEVYLLIIQLVIITIFIPLTFYYLLLSLGKVDSIMLADKEQRKLPLTIHAVLLYVLTQKSITLESWMELYFFFFGSLISTMLALMMVFAGYKVSLHMIGTTALTTFLIGVSLHFQVRLVMPIVVLVLCNGLVASSRLRLRAHTMQELVLGSLIGVIPQAALLYFWL